MLKLGTIRIFTKVLSKVSKIRNRDAKQKVLSALEKNEYFQRFIHNPIERQQFLKSASPYVKYRFYPKGTAIIELQKHVSSFSVVVRGKVLLYKPKTAEELAKDALNYNKAQVIQLYLRYIAAEQLEEKFKKWLSKNELGTKALRRRMTSLTLDEHEKEREANVPENDNFNLVIEEVLKPKNKLLPSHLREADLSFEEKLLLLSTFGNQGDHLVNGHIGLKKDSELMAGETFLDAGLIKTISPNFMVIAAEDTHTVSFAKLDYKYLFASDIQNLKEKIDFLRRIFVEIPRQYIMEMAYYLEEKVISNSEMVYKEGEDVDAIYMVKHGEIEITTMKEVHSIEENILMEYKNSNKLKNKFTEKQKIMIGRIPAGSIFGEEEVIKRVKCRKYSARALQPGTFLYTIRKRIFYEIFEKYFPDVSRMLKDWMDLKYRWREQRIRKEKEIAGLRGDDTSADKAAEKKEEPKKLRRTVTRRETEGDGQTDDNAMIMASMIQRLNNISPFNDNATNVSPNFYFAKSNKSIGPILRMSPRNRSQPKGNSARKGSQEIVENVQGIERQKTRLFLENQPRNKFKRQVIVQKVTPKGPSGSFKRPSEAALKNSLATPPILNFDKVKDVQTYDAQPKPKSQPRYEIHGGLGSINSLNADSFRKITPTSQTSPRFFIVKSFRATNGGSQNSIDNEVLGRRHSTHLLPNQENDYGAPIITPNMDFRRGTVGTVAGEPSMKDKVGSDQKLYHNDHRKKVPIFMSKPAGSLQHFDRQDKNAPYLASSVGGSLNHLDSRHEDASIAHELKGERKLSGPNKSIQFAKKMLSTRITPEQYKVSSRPGTSYVRLKVNGINLDKHAE